jgi:hypothetical protein
LLIHVVLFNHIRRAIPAERFAIALPQPPKSELLAAALRYRTPSNPQTANCLQQRFAIASPNFPNSELLAAALRYRIPSTSQHPFLTNHRDTEDTEKERSHPLKSPNSELLAAALRYRTPSLPKQRTACSSASLSHPSTSQKRLHPSNPQTANCLQQRFAIALPPTPQTANCLQQRFAIAPPQLPKSELLAAALRYRTPSTSPNSELTSQRLRYRIPSTPQTANCLQQRFAIAPLNSPNSDSYGVLHYRI